MNEIDDMLSNRARTDNPFRVPEGYFESLEDRLAARIAAEEAGTPKGSRRVWQALKPALMMAAMFAIIFGMGYGALSLTHTLDRGTGTPAVSDYASLEEELIRSSSLLNYYQSDFQVDDEDAEIDEESLISYLSTELSFADLAEYIAQSYQK